MVDVYGKFVGRYTVRPMDSMYGIACASLFFNLGLSFHKSPQKLIRLYYEKVEVSCLGGGPGPRKETWNGPKKNTTLNKKHGILPRILFCCFSFAG